MIVMSLVKSLMIIKKTNSHYDFAEKLTDSIR